MKSQRLSVLLLCLGMACTGCKHEEKQPQISNGINTSHNHEVINETQSAVEIPEQYCHEAGNIKFDTEVSVPENVKNSGMKKISASLQTIDCEKAVECLMGDEKINNSGENGSEKWYEGTNQSVLSVSPETLSYSTKFNVYVSNAFRLQKGYSDYNADRYSTEDNLKFETKESAFKNIKATLENMGIRVEDTYTCYALDYETMKQEEAAMDMDGNEASQFYKENWTQEDDSYYFLIRQEYEGIPEYHVFYDIMPELAEDNAPVQVLYNKNGIQFLQIEKVFDYSETKDTYKLKDFSAIAEVIEKKYGMLLGNSTYEVTSASLHYMESKAAESEYEVQPVWIFFTKENSTGQILQDIVNAQTGEEVIWKEN